MDTNENIFAARGLDDLDQVEVDTDTLTQTTVVDGKVFVEADFIDEVFKAVATRYLLDGDVIALTQTYVVAKIFQDLKAHRLSLGL